MNARLLILDLDETLIYGAETALERPADFRAGAFHIYKRPHLADFLAGCFSLFRVAVWTSASPAYAQAVVQSIFPAPDELLFVWASDRCSHGFDGERYAHYPRKPLAKLRRLRRVHGWERGDILAVDDSPEKWELSYGNLIRVRPYTGTPNDDELSLLLRYLEIISQEPDVRRVDKRGWRDHEQGSSDDAVSIQ